MNFQCFFLKIIFFSLFNMNLIFSMPFSGNQDPIQEYTLSSFGALQSYSDLKKIFNIEPDLLSEKINLILDNSIKFELNRRENRSLWFDNIVPLKNVFFNLTSSYSDSDEAESIGDTVESAQEDYYIDLIDKLPTHIEKYDLSDIDQKEELKIISIGDLHGNFTALDSIILNLIKEKILTIDLKLDPSYRIVCLGDYIDRGTRSLEILIVLMTLKLLNPEKVILLKGNHEEAHIFQCSGFTVELKKSLGASQTDLMVFSDNPIVSKFNCFFHLLPNAYFFKNKDGQLFQFNHAGWVNLSDLNDFFLSDKKFFEIDSCKAQGFIWNDTLKSNVDFYDLNISRGVGLVYSSNLILKEMKQFKVAAKFGGHQHDMPKNELFLNSRSSIGFVSITDDISYIFILISGTIGNGIHYFPSYLQLNIKDQSFNISGFSEYKQGVFFKI